MSSGGAVDPFFLAMRRLPDILQKLRFPPDVEPMTVKVDEFRKILDQSFRNSRDLKGLVRFLPYHSAEALDLARDGRLIWC